MGAFQFVYVPCDGHRSLEQWSVESSEDGCPLSDRLKRHYVQAHPFDTKAQRKREIEKIMREKGISADEAQKQLVDADMDKQLIDSFYLLICSKKRNYVGVRMYVDDGGYAKGLPLNKRATDIVSFVGMGYNIVGDAFVVRLWNCLGEGDYMDFLLSEMSTDASWMREAQSEYALSHSPQKTSQPVAEDQRKDLKQEPAITKMTSAEDARQKGNDTYRKGDYSAAIEAYTLSLENDPTSALAYSNRAMAHLQLANFEDALSDADAALQRLDALSVKAQYRRGVALEGLGRTGEAIDAFKQVLNQQPNNKAASQKLEELGSPQKGDN